MSDITSKSLNRSFIPWVAMTFVMGVSQAIAQETVTTDIRTGLVGYWIINEDLSDNTDDQVEAAIIEAGGRPQRRGFFSREEDIYRGGPAEQELYDRISYDDILTVEYNEPEFVFEYADQYRRVFHSDGRTFSTGANAFYTEGGQDSSIANFEGNTLLVEARPRDGGFTLETYTLIDGGNRLRVEMEIEPASFGATIILMRVYDRATSQ